MKRNKSQPLLKSVARCSSSLPSSRSNSAPSIPFSNMRKMQSVVYASVQRRPRDGRTEAFVPLCESAYARRQINEQITHNTMQWQWRRRAAVTCDSSEKLTIGCVVLQQCYRLTQPPREGVKRQPGNTEGATLKRTASPPQRIMYVRP